MRNDLDNQIPLGSNATLMDVDTARIQKEEFEAAAVLTSILWGPGGFAEMLGPTWQMVNDPRYTKVERMGVIHRNAMFGGVADQGVALIMALDCASELKIVDDLVIFSELIGEGRHFLKACQQREVPAKQLEADSDLRWKLIEQECPNYKSRLGVWNQDARRLDRMMEAGLVSLVEDFCPIALSQDWIRMDTGEVVSQGVRLDDGESPTVAVEIDTLQKALTFRAQVRFTALRCLQQYPGLLRKTLQTWCSRTRNQINSVKFCSRLKAWKIFTQSCPSC